ncbi:hypothetical protein [Akkermansia sp.]|uniref:hypothetical protein n=1 Tax=Akkermansia sp. TaxID=1872421 RepID=UPI0025BC26DC|nr:hypothetical protein [Akkermansia sp.]
MNKTCLFANLLVGLSLSSSALCDQADNGIECSVVMEKTSFDARETFPDFKLVFANKGEKTVRLFDDVYPVVRLREPRREKAPNIHIEIWRKENGKRLGVVRLERETPIAWYGPMYMFERVGALMRFITLKPGEKHEVSIKDAYLLLVYFEHLRNGEWYELEVRFKDGYAEPGVRREYVGRQEFKTSNQSPEGVRRW